MPHVTLALSPYGPILPVMVGVSKAKEQSLLSVGQPVPKPILVQALVDTGANCTCVDPAVVHWGSQPTQGIPILVNKYDISLVFDFPGLVCKRSVSALEAQFILSHSLFVYDGKANTFALSF